MKHIVIIGNGISGITAARWIRKLSDYKITVISSESDHFYSRTALMYIYMGHMEYQHTKPYEDWFWGKNRIGLLTARVSSVETTNNTLHLESGETITYDTLLLATGSVPNRFGWPGQDLEGVTGMYSLQDLETIEKYTKGIHRGVIVGGGLIGIELAEMLHSRGIKVTFLVRESNFWNNILPDEEASLVSNQIYQNGIDLRLNTELKEILPDSNGNVKSVIASNGDEIPCQFVGLTAGVGPNIGFLKNSGIKTDRGILVNEFLQTNISNVYAIGDCAQHIHPPKNRKSIEQVWYTGRMQGETVAHTICGKQTAYNPGIWFNSAKFFDLEYQTYGWVWNKLMPDEDSFYWQNEKGNKCLRLVYNKTTTALTGLNVFGIRMRHEVAENWIKNKTPVNEVIAALKQANFDPEFYEHHEQTIRHSFEKTRVKQIGMEI